MNRDSIAGRLTAFTMFLSVLLLLAPGVARGQDTAANPAAEKTFTETEIDQLVAPIALYPDELLSQILMASTYPLEIVEASRWRKENPKLADDALTKALEQREWDASVKSLVNFPDVLKVMDEKLDWTQKLGNAFLAQKEDVMSAVQKLRKKAQDEGNLKTTEQQKVVVEETVIVIESADPEVVYVPTYNPTVVYGAWPYPSYPPYQPYPYGAAAFSFAAGVAVGAAWGYAWGHCNWNGGDVDIDIDRNTNRNTNINRDKYKQQMQNRTGGKLSGGKGSWQHDPSHRKGVNYADKGSQQRYNRGPSKSAGSREAYRGRSEPSRGGSASTRPSTGSSGQRGGTSSQRGSASSQKSRSSTAFEGYGGRSETQRQSSRGQSSRQSYSRSTGGRSSGSASRSSGSRGGGRSGGGGGRGGGRR